MAVGLSAALVTQLLFLASDNFYADIRLFMIWLTAGTLQALCLLQQRARRRELESPTTTTPSTTVPSAWREAA